LRFVFPGNGRWGWWSVCLFAAGATVILTSLTPALSPQGEGTVCPLFGWWMTVSSIQSWIFARKRERFTFSTGGEGRDEGVVKPSLLPKITKNTAFSRTDRKIAARTEKLPHGGKVGLHGAGNCPHRSENRRTDGKTAARNDKPLARSGRSPAQTGFQGTGTRFSSHGAKYRRTERFSAARDDKPLARSEFSSHEPKNGRTEWFSGARTGKITARSLRTAPCRRGSMARIEGGREALVSH
jgi:hypothetical protein